MKKRRRPRKRSASPSPAKLRGKGTFNQAAIEKVAALLNRDERRKKAREDELAALQIDEKDRRRAIGTIGVLAYDAIVRLKGEASAKFLTDALARKIKKKSLVAKAKRKPVEMMDEARERFYSFDENRGRKGKRHYRRVINSDDVAEYKGERPTGKILKEGKANAAIRRQRTEDMINGLKTLTGMTRKESMRVIMDVKKRESRAAVRFKKTKTYKALDQRQRRRYTMERARGRAYQVIREFLVYHGWGEFS